MLEGEVGAKLWHRLQTSGYTNIDFVGGVSDGGGCNPGYAYDFDHEGHAGGWLANKVGLVDFAGGTAVEITSGASALALALVIGTRVYVYDE